MIALAQLAVTERDVALRGHRTGALVRGADATTDQGAS